MYEIMNITTHGAGHIKKGDPCEDYSISLAEDFYKIFVVADGHGDSNCPRSRIGSETICRIASEEMKNFACDIQSEGWTDRLFDPYKREHVIRQLITSIIGKWKEAVCEDFEQNPLTDEERAGCDRYLEKYDRGERIDHIYGSTMIAGLMTEDYLLLLQQGDGRCDVFDQYGEVSQPIPWDDRCFSNVCTSLCDSDAIESCRYYVIDMKKDPITACLAGSDGVEDSYSDMEMMHSYYRDLLVFAAENSVEELHIMLEATLPDFSAKGSNDDVSIGGFMDLERVRALVDKFETENEWVATRSKLKIIEERITSMESGKMQYLEQRFQKAEIEYMKDASEEKRQKYENAQQELEEYKSRYEDYLMQRDKTIREMEALKNSAKDEETPDESV